jgi:hypothetical protein
MKINSQIHPDDFNISKEGIMKCEPFTHLEYLRCDHHDALAEALLWSQSLNTPVSILETSQHTYVALPGSIGVYKVDLKEWLEKSSVLTWENSPQPDTVVTIHKDNLLLDRRPFYTFDGEYAVILLAPHNPEEINHFYAIYQVGSLTIAKLWDLCAWATLTKTPFITFNGEIEAYGELEVVEVQGSLVIQP